MMSVQKLFGSFWVRADTGRYEPEKTLAGAAQILLTVNRER